MKTSQVITLTKQFQFFRSFVRSFVSACDNEECEKSTKSGLEEEEEEEEKVKRGAKILAKFVQNREVCSF